MSPTSSNARFAKRLVMALCLPGILVGLYMASKLLIQPSSVPPAVAWQAYRDTSCILTSVSDASPPKRVYHCAGKEYVTTYQDVPPSNWSPVATVVPEKAAQEPGR